MLKIYDLDQTVINSDTRYNEACESGSFCVDTYRKGQTLQNLLSKDSLLPLALQMQDDITKGRQVAIVTARELMAGDWAWLKMARLIPRDLNMVFHRGNHPEPSQQNNGLYKKPILEQLKAEHGACFLIDDDIGVLEVAKELGIKSANAIDLNNFLLNR